MVNYDYSKDDIITALKKVGVCNNDSIYVQSNLGFFGKLKDATDKISYGKVFKDAIFEVIGLEGTLVVPAFSYSFCNQLLLYVLSFQVEDQSGFLKKFLYLNR